MSKPITDRDLNDEMSYSDFAVDWNISIPYNPELPDHILQETKTFRLIHEIAIEDLQGITDYSYTIKPNVLDYESFEMLPVNNFTNNIIFSDILLNSRLHIANPTVLFAKGDNKPLPDWILIAYEKAQVITIPDTKTSLTITTSSGTDKLLEHQQIQTEKNYYDTYIERADIPLWIDNTSIKYFVTNHQLSYPDSRSEGMRYFYHKNSDDKYYLAHLYSILYTPHKYRELGVRESKWDYVNSTVRLWKTRAINFNENGMSGVDLDAVILYSDREVQSNRVQVSQVNNPFYYPAENSYRIGRLSNTIIGLSSQAEPMSTGQYGNYPLIIFTQEGIFSLEQGENNILYKSIQPVSLEVCNNPDSIITINNGILFGTDRGLLVLSGRKIIELSKIVEGKPKSDIKSDTNYLNAINGTDSITNLSSAISGAGFLTYMENAKIAYDQNKKELIITNQVINEGVKTYSYIYSLEENVWYKSSQLFNEFIINSPNWYAFDGSNIYNLSEENSLSGNVEILIKTNPIKFETFDLKTIERLVARYNGSVSGATNKLALYLYGSLDGKEWKLISGIKPLLNEGESERELTLRKVRTTARYFVIFVATKAYEGVVQGFDVEVNLKQAKKIR